MNLMKRFIDEKFQSKNYVPSTSEEVEYIVERTKEMMENNLRLINWARNLYSSMRKASLLEKRKIEKNSGLSPEEIMKNLVENYEPPTYGFPVSVISLNVEELKEIMRNSSL
ncbi:MAG: hypothetical protein J7L34_08555 [Thermotogaceae bacterium]|nr:hypothetical protein [Thermotogaceae bacterium]